MGGDRRCVALLPVEIQQLSWEGAGRVCSRVVTEAFVPWDTSFGDSPSCSCGQVLIVVHSTAGCPLGRWDGAEEETISLGSLLALGRPGFGPMPAV